MTRTVDQRKLNRAELADYFDRLATDLRREGDVDVPAGSRRVTLAPPDVVDFGVDVSETDAILRGRRETVTITVGWRPRSEKTADERRRGRLTVAEIHPDPEGPDRGNLGEEYVTFKNVGKRRLDLEGWSVRDDQRREDVTYEFEDCTLEQGETVTLRTGRGDDTATDRYWGRQQPVWNNGEDTVVVYGDDGEIVLERPYARSYL